VSRSNARRFKSAAANEWVGGAYGRPKQRSAEDARAQIVSSVKTVHGFTYTICKPGIATNATRYSNEQRVGFGSRLRTADPADGGFE
jgi:hypothetical protein